MNRPPSFPALSKRVAYSVNGRYRHAALLALLVLLWLALQQGPETWMGRLFWLADVATFLLWQPLVRVDRRLDRVTVLMIFAGLSVIVTLLGWGWMALWVLFLAAMIGGKVLVAPRRRERWFYLLAFFDLAVILLLWISPKLIPVSGLVEHPIIIWVDVIALAVIGLAMILLPPADPHPDREFFDFLTGFFVLLVLAVLLLGTSALMLFRQTGYFQALTLVILTTAAVLLLVSWWAAPKQGVGGVESLLTAYLLRVGFPFEIWLQSLMQIVERKADPREFLIEAVTVFARIPWVVGGVCVTPEINHSFGDRGRGIAQFAHRDASLVLYTQHAWTASLTLQASLIFRLIVELAEAKRREAALLEMRYLRSVHEAGARVTHDVKNILQALDNLCFAAVDAAADDVSVRRLLARQLPVLSSRLHMTLQRLRAPDVSGSNRGDLGAWWELLQSRYASSGIEFSGDPEGPIEVAGELFDSIVDNLMVNALEKRGQGHCRQIQVELRGRDGGAELSVSDDGAAIDPDLARQLFSRIAPSQSGLGIGLWQAARLAQQIGYRLTLDENRAGRVRFKLQLARGDRSSPT